MRGESATDTTVDKAEATTLTDSATTDNRDNGVNTESNGSDNSTSNSNSGTDPAVPWELGRRLVKATEAGEEAAIREVGQNYDPVMCKHFCRAIYIFLLEGLYHCIFSTITYFYADMLLSYIHKRIFTHTLSPYTST